MADYSKIKHLKDLNNSMFNERMNRAYDYGYEDGLARGTECGYKRGYENGEKSKQTDKERLNRMTRKEASKIIKDGLEDMSLDFADEEQYDALEMAIKALQEPKSPCDLCRYNPPSSGDGKPCTMCPSEGRAE